MIHLLHWWQYDDATQELLERFLETPLAQTVHAGPQGWVLTQLRREGTGLVVATLCAEPDGHPIVRFPMPPFDFPDRDDAPEPRTSGVRLRAGARVAVGRAR